MSNLRGAAAMLVASRALILAIEIVTLSADMAIQRAIHSQDSAVPDWFVATQLWMNTHFMTLVYVAGLASLFALSWFATATLRLARSSRFKSTIMGSLLLLGFCAPILNLVLPWAVLLFTSVELMRCRGVSVRQGLVGVSTIGMAVVFDTCLLIDGWINSPDLQVHILRQVPAYAEFPVLLNSEQNAIRSIEAGVSFALLVISAIYARSTLSTLAPRRRAVVAVFDP